MTSKLTIFSSIVIGSLLVSACTASEVVPATRTPASPSSDLDGARTALLTFFDDLYTGQYDAAADLFGGDLSLLVDSNPAVDSSDIAALLEAACTYQLRCLPVKAIVDARQVSDGSYAFELEFSKPDGSLFVLGPCCGANETEMPPISQFDCSVEKSSEGDYKVMCLPVYVP